MSTTVFMLAVGYRWDDATSDGDQLTGLGHDAELRKILDHGR